MIFPHAYLQRTVSWIFAALLSLTAYSAGADTSQPSTQRDLPALFIIGDSTVKNHGKMIQGWGDPIAAFFDRTRIVVENDALAGRSSRTFVTEGLWEKVHVKLRKGDFVLMQFGHNDTKAPISANRYSLPGLGEETEDAVDPKTEQPIVIHTYGWYMRKMIAEALASGAEPIVLSPVPRCKWANGKIVRGEEHHGQWAAEVAAAAGVPFIDLNGLIADRYDPIGQPIIKAMYFPMDNTHTNPAGARVNAACVVLGLLQLKECPLAGYLLDSSSTEAAAAATITPTTQPVPATQP
jgi:rhamnogalacturonan acetylesterase